jgi:hypothetical protein
LVVFWQQEVDACQTAAIKKFAGSVSWQFGLGTLC